MKQLSFRSNQENQIKNTFKNKDLYFFICLDHKPLVMNLSYITLNFKETRVIPKFFEKIIC